MPDGDGSRSHAYEKVNESEKEGSQKPVDSDRGPSATLESSSELLKAQEDVQAATPLREDRHKEAATPLREDGNKEAPSQAAAALAGRGKFESYKAVLFFLVVGVATVLLAIVFLLPSQSKVKKLEPFPPPPPEPRKGRCNSKLRPKESLCTGCPPMRDGKLCASTTRYNDMTKGSCGCGFQDPVPPNFWTLTQFTAALNCKNLDPEHPLLSWCPAGCGACFELCSTGGTTSGKPNTTKGGVCRVFTVTNRCGDGYKEYPEWCSNELTYEECRLDPARCQRWGSTNKYGYPAHFDLQDYHLQVSSGLNWDNAEVTFEPVACNRWTGSLRECVGCTLVNKGQWQDRDNATAIV